MRAPIPHPLRVGKEPTDKAGSEWESVKFPSQLLLVLTGPSFLS